MARKGHGNIIRIALLKLSSYTCYIFEDEVITFTEGERCQQGH